MSERTAMLLTLACAVLIGALIGWGDVMICYKDRTFCVQDTCAKRDTCGNYLSEGHKRNAEKSGLPIAQALYLGCFVAESTPLIAQGATDAVH